MKDAGGARCGIMTLPQDRNMSLGFDIETGFGMHFFIDNNEFPNIGLVCLDPWLECEDGHVPSSSQLTCRN